MQFTSLSFLIFAAVVLTAYYLPSKGRRWVILLLASLFFYLQAGRQYIFFLLFTALSTYFCTRFMGANLEKQEIYLKENKTSLSREEKKQYKASVKAKNRIAMILCLVLALAMLAESAEGTSRIDRLDQIDRGDHNRDERLNRLGARITRVEL